MESLVNPSFWRGKTVLVTGHTGFKGSWLCTWLLAMGATVKGLSLAPDTTPSLFEQLNLAQGLDHTLGDIRNLDLVKKWVRRHQPDILFHLAAQPLVRLSYQAPVETWSTNVMGTIHLLEALKDLDSPCAAVFITTDKCYDNREWVYGYRESDPLGGYDPYSSSKAGAELAIASWRDAFFTQADCPVGIASARAGNVIGGGDWAQDRIVPDAMRALHNQQAIAVRNPHATRPWQHVLDPLGGYLALAEKIYAGCLTTDKSLHTAFNFGPALTSNRPVKALVECILQHWPGSWQDCSDPEAVHEASRLNLVTDKAFHQLGWSPQWDFEQTIAATVHWYRQAHQLEPSNHQAFQQLTQQQIQQYQKLPAPLPTIV